MAIKDEIAIQWNATPLPLPSHLDDWSASGGTLDFVLVARAAIAEMQKMAEEQLRHLT